MVESIEILEETLGNGAEQRIELSILDGCFTSVRALQIRIRPSIERQESVLPALASYESELLALGLENLAAEPAPDREDVEVERGVVLRLLSGPSFFVASHLLRLDRLLPQKLDYGALVCTPTRHLLMIHTIRDSRVLMAINAIIPQSYLHHQRGPGSLTPNVYWWHHGQLTLLPTTVDPYAVKFTPPPEFVKQVMDPMAAER